MQDIHDQHGTGHGVDPLPPLTSTKTGNPTLTLSGSAARCH